MQDEAEASHAQYQLFTAFREFIDTDLLGEWLAARGLSYGDFTEACIDAADASEAARQYIDILAASFEFPLFVQIMRIAQIKLENLGDPRNAVPPPPEEPPPPPPPLVEGKHDVGEYDDGIAVTAGAGAALLEQMEQQQQGEGKAAAAGDETESKSVTRANKK